jgi:hypothetical protein
MRKARNKSTPKSDTALLDIRKALEKKMPSYRRLPDKLNACIKINLARDEREKFKSFFLLVEHLGDVDLEKIATRVRVSKKILDEWMNNPEISQWVNSFLNRGRRRRARSVVFWAKMLSKRGTIKLKAPPDADGEIHANGIDYGNMLPLAKDAARAFEHPELFRSSIELVLDFHKHCGISSAKQFFIDLGKCLSHGIRGTRGIKPELWDKLDVDVADIILSHDPPLSDKQAVHELQKRGHVLRGHLPALEVRFRQRKRRLIFDAHSVALSLME